MLAFASLGGPAIAQQPGSALAQILLSPGDGGLTLTASVIALADVSGSAELRVLRIGASGEFRTTQSQAFDLAAGAEMVVARLSLSMGAGDRLQIDAVLTSGDTIISTTRIDAGGHDQNSRGNN